MVLEALVWKTSPGACDVEPPVSGRGPWSTTVTRSQPRAVSSSARLAPTIPAPMMTTRGVVGIALLLTCRSVWVGPSARSPAPSRAPARACGGWGGRGPATARGGGQRGPSSAGRGGGELEGRVEQPVGEVAGEGGPDEDDVVVGGVAEGQQHD